MTNQQRIEALWKTLNKAEDNVRKLRAEAKEKDARIRELVEALKQSNHILKTIIHEGGIASKKIERQVENNNSTLKGETKMIHNSDCAIYNEPAYPAGKCDCRVRMSMTSKIDDLIANVAYRFGNDYPGSTVGILGRQAVEICEKLNIPYKELE